MSSSFQSRADVHEGDVPEASRRGAWMALIAAMLGWMFDGFEMGLFPVVARPALRELLGTVDGSDGAVGLWFGVITAGFLVGAATGGVPAAVLNHQCQGRGLQCVFR